MQGAEASLRTSADYMLCCCRLQASITQAQAQDLQMADSFVQQARREWTKEVASYRQTSQVCWCGSPQ
jgi:hypothetical protein